MTEHGENDPLIEYYRQHPQEISLMMKEIGDHHPASVSIAALEMRVRALERKLEGFELDVRKIRIPWQVEKEAQEDGL